MNRPSRARAVETVAVVRAGVPETGEAVPAAAAAKASRPVPHVADASPVVRNGRHE